MRLGKAIVGCSIWMLSQWLCLGDSNIWLTAQANQNAWPGSSNAPFYAGNAAAFTALLLTNTPNCTFHYAPGTYQTLGYYWRVRSTANKGCKHFGAGIDKTVIQLVGAGFGPEGCIFGADSDALMDGFEVHDLTLDCNAVHNARYTNGFSSCTAVNVGGNDILIDGVKVIGFGTGNGKIECFAVYVGPQLVPPSGRTNFQNIVVQHCIFTAPAPTNAMAVGCCTVMGATGLALSNAAIRFCCVSNVASYFPGTHCFYAPLVENCVADSEYYIEPGWLDEAHRDWIVRSNVFLKVTRGIYIGFGAGRRIRSLTVEGNQFVLASPPAAAFSFGGPLPSQGEGFDWLVLRNNTVIATNGTSPDTVGFSLGRISHAVVESNQMIFANGLGLKLESATITSRWFSANINAARSLWFVTNWDLGTTNSQAVATRWQTVKPPAVNVRLLPGL
jgi:hypothetical protein